MAGPSISRIKNFFFSPPCKCRIDIIGLLANRTMFKRECMLSILREGGLSSPTSAEPRRVTQAPRDRFGSACASSSLGPWSDDPSASVGGRDRTISAARIRSGSTPGSCTRAFPYSPTVARFDPRQAGQTLNHGFPRWPVHKPSFRKK